MLVGEVVKQKVDPKHLTVATQMSVIAGSSSPTMNRHRKPTLVIVFVVGGISLEETIDIQGAIEPDFDIISGGTHLLNTSM